MSLSHNNKHLIQLIYSSNFKLENDRACCQVLGDLAAVAHLRRGISGARVAVLTAGGPVAHAWLRAARRLPLDLVLVIPSGGRAPDVTTVVLSSFEQDMLVR